ncbi:hypothetical protein [Microbacterium sp.]|uniref:hypothetical protein n=1 Tax=Microbacterium sp. TaxID=51671 RepID=UPI003A907621
MSAATDRTSPGFRRRRARVVGVLAVCGAVVCAALAALGYSTAGSMPEMWGVALPSTVLALLWLLLALLGFQTARHCPDTLALSGPLRLFGILGVVVGVAGGVITLWIGIAHHSPVAAFLMALMIALGVVTLTVSAALYTLAVPPKERADGSSSPSR